MSKFTYNSTIIDYEIIGDGVPILFLHGWGMDKRIMTGCFEPIFDNLNNFRRIYIDLPGMGMSTAGDVTCSDDMLEILHSFTEEIVGEKFIIAGESYGGYLARGFVKQYPEMVNGIILLCPLVYPGTRQGRVEPLKVIKRDDDFLSTLTKEQYDSFTYMNVVLTKSVYERYSKDIMPAIEIQDRYFLDEVLDGSYSFDVDEIEQPFEFPCLIVVGKQDTEVGYKDQFNLIKNFPNATYCAINGAGHNLQLEQPELFESIVKQWLIGSFPEALIQKQ